MKIAILLLNAGRGSGEVARQQARQLVARGHEVHYMHPAMKEGAPGAVNLNIELHTETVPVHEYLPSAAGNQQQVARMDFETAESYFTDYENALESVIDGVGMIIGHHANISAVATHRVAKRHNIPYVLFLHGTGIEPRHEGLYDDRLWAMIQQAIESAAGIIVTTEYVRDHLVRGLLDLPEDRFIILPCGIDLEEFRPEPDPAVIEKFALPETFVICPGALTASKGPQNVVAASAEYADLAPTVFIGDGELRAELEAELDDRGKFLGFVSAEDKAALIRSASVLTAAPEKKEHFGIIYAEGLAAGTVPVTYEGGGVGSVVTPETGTLTERDARALGQAIRARLSDPKELAATAKRARVRAETCFDTGMLGGRLHEWLLSLAAG